MSDVSPGPVSGDASSTDEIIENARRPVVVARHKDAVLTLEKELNTRDLVAEPEEGEGLDMLKRIAAQGGDPDHLLRDAVTEQLCIIRDRENATDSRIKALLVDIYSHAKHLVEARHRQGLALFDLRTIAARDLPRLWQTEPIEFGKAGFHEQLIIPQTQFESRLRVVLRFNKARNGDKTWHEASGEPRLSRQMEAPLLDLPEEERKKAREELVAHTIRSYFYRKVFRRYFDRDTLDPAEIEAHPTILDWLTSIEQTPHLFPFMQGQTTSQKIFRLSRLLRKIISVNELYQRVDQGSQHPSYREKFEGLGTRERLSILAKDRYPALPVDDAFMVATVSCPFDSFARWVQGRLVENDLVLPPDA